MNLSSDVVAENLKGKIYAAFSNTPRAEEPRLELGSQKNYSFVKLILSMRYLPFTDFR